MERPIIGIPLGDPAGIGPEITVKTFEEKRVWEVCRPFLIGDLFVINRAIEITGSKLKVNVVSSVEDAKFEEGTIDMLDLDIVNSDYEFGKVDARCGLASFKYVEKTAKLCMEKKLDAMATTPINKESLRVADVPYIGHTEMLEEVSGVHDPLTMFEVNNLRVFFLSRHVSLSKAIEMVKYDRVLDYIIRCSEAMKKLGVEGTMAVAGLNPHCGEHGLFGYEEVEEIEPAIKEAQKRGYDVVGPIGADSVFHMALEGTFSSVLSLYHDQGHIATKTYDFYKTIAITNSMPFLRTSVDHGTAYPVAGKNIASAVSMIEAVILAAKYAPKFNHK